MTVDLSKLQAGDTVHFRCGGSAVVSHVRNKKGASDDYGVSLECKSAACSNTNPPDGWYQQGGTLHGTSVKHPFDITRIEPKPFDWSTVKPGMGFRTISEEDFWYIGPDISSENHVVVADEKEALLSSEVRVLPKGVLTRAPEHDITPPTHEKG